MVNLIIVTHGELGVHLAETAETIVGEQSGGVEVVSIPPRISAKIAQKQLSAALDKAYSKDGIIIFTDILGGTPTNIAIPSSENKNNIAVISGVNLTMVITAFSYRNKLTFKALVEKITSDGKNSIWEVKALLNKMHKHKGGG